MLLKKFMKKKIGKNTNTARELCTSIVNRKFILQIMSDKKYNEQWILYKGSVSEIRNMINFRYVKIYKY